MRIESYVSDLEHLCGQFLYFGEKGCVKFFIVQFVLQILAELFEGNFIGWFIFPKVLSLTLNGIIGQMNELGSIPICEFF